MPYLGRSSQKAIRQRFIFTQASSGATSISGADDSNATLRFDDGEYVDVILNGVTLAKTEYNTTTANTIGGLAALSTDDVLQVTVYDMFNVADAVSASSGGTFNGGVTINGDLTVTGSGAGAAGVVSASTSGTAISIDSSNRVTTPARPSFSAYRTKASGGADNGTTGVIVFNNEDHDIGGCFNTSDGKFTAPIAGIYAFQFVGFYCVNAAGAACTPNSYFSYLYKNSSVVAIHYDYFSGSGDTHYIPANISIILQLAASDTIHIQTHSATYLYADLTRGYATFSGFLVG